MIARNPTEAITAVILFALLVVALMAAYVIGQATAAPAPVQAPMVTRSVCAMCVPAAP